MMKKLFEPVKLGELSLAHRIVLAPLTRMRADNQTLSPVKMMEEYYVQRATKGGLMITEATLISSEGLLDHCVPGIWNQGQVNGWKKIVDAVHDKGGLMSIQLWHTGRCAHESFKNHPAVVPGWEPTVSAGDIAVGMDTRSTLTGEKLPYSKPRALKTEEIPRLIQDYVKAAKNAKEAGFDCIELHAAHGYLLDQFMNDGTNNRTDKYGGSMTNRCRLLVEVVEALGTVYPFGRIAVRLSPHPKKSLTYYNADDTDPDALYAHAIKSLDKFNLAYLLLSEPRWLVSSISKDPATDTAVDMPLYNPSKYRGLYKGAILGCGGFTPASAEAAVQSGEYDSIAFGRWFISNPDLVDRIRLDQPFHVYNRKTFYTHDEKGYIDYPTFENESDKSALIAQSRIGKTLTEARL